jgi:hypothetical protein
VRLDLRLQGLEARFGAARLDLARRELGAVQLRGARSALWITYHAAAAKSHDSIGPRTKENLYQ